MDNVPAMFPPETLIPALKTGIWFIVTTPSAAIAMESVSLAEPILPSSGITMMPPVVNRPPPVIAPLKVAAPAALISNVSAVIPEPPSSPLKMISLSVLWLL